jgi:hypothetical protein
MTMRWWVALVCAVAWGCASESAEVGGGGGPTGGNGGGTTDAGTGGGQSGCIDNDQDGYGEGTMCRGADCDDTNPAIHPGVAELCDGLDNDCNGQKDDNLGLPECPLSLGVCAGAQQLCVDGAFTQCGGAASYGQEFEDIETRCDGLDNDCDGRTDEANCACDIGSVQQCGSGEGECQQGLQRCDTGTWGACENEVGPTEEVCDGRDNDCDGTIDESLQAPDCALSDGVCAGASQTCTGAGGWSVCGQAEYGAMWRAEEGPADCDGMDNDCDGESDEQCTCENGQEQPCGSEIGACEPGAQTCTDGTWGDCRGAVEPQPEACDGVDNDCDGNADEGIEAPNCTLQQGVCVGATRTCGGAEGWLACSPETYAAHSPRYVEVETAEQCDGIDNDCDGLIDEECECQEGAMQLCGANVGVCTQGMQTCVGGRFGECDGTGPSGEICDGLDNDCDMRIDEDLRGPDCAQQQGVCAGAVQRCVDGAWGQCGAEEYGVGYDGANELRCDGVDNNCDGEIDEGCECEDGSIQNCGSETGACSRGSQTCVRGRWSACEGAVDPADELCDGLDNDCDESMDEALVGPGCALQVGVCAGSTQSCGGAAGFVAACGVEEYGENYRVMEGAEDCDGLDNDCDGEIDEECECSPGDEQVCGVNVGACQTGLQMCAGGRYGDCEGAIDPTQESCDGADNDCDGETDESLQAPACALQLGVCVGAVQTCTGEGGWGVCGQVEYGELWAADEGAANCDGLDNDCDGLVDEGCPNPAVVISEVFYDQTGADGSQVFIELAGEPGLRLNGLALEFVNGSNGESSAVASLDGGRVPFNGYFLIVGEGATDTLRDIADLVIRDADLQNGPDSLRLVWNGQTTIDAVAWLGAGADGAFPDMGGAGEGMPAGPVEEGQSLSRDDNDTDTDDNATDFVASQPTPGGAVLPRVHIALRWDTDDTDFDLRLLRGGATWSDVDGGTCYFGNRTPDWGIADESADDPRLDRDDTEGFGPEFIDFPAPPSDIYMVAAQYWGPDDGPITNATLSIFVDDALALSLTQSMNGTDRQYWAGAQIIVEEDGTISVEGVDMVGNQQVDNL